MINSVNNKQQTEIIAKNSAANNLQFGQQKKVSSNDKRTRVSENRDDNSKKDKKISEKTEIIGTKLLEKINSRINRKIRPAFSIHKETKSMILRVYDQDSKELIREFPPEKILELKAFLKEIAGNFINKTI